MRHLAAWLLSACLAPACHHTAPTPAATRVAPAATAATTAPSTHGSSIVTFEGNAATILAASHTDGVVVEDHGQHTLGPDRYSVSARASDEGIALLRARGLTVTVVYTAEEMEEHFRQMDRESQAAGRLPR